MSRSVYGYHEYDEFDVSKGVMEFELSLDFILLDIFKNDNSLEQLATKIYEIGGNPLHREKDIKAVERAKQYIAAMEACIVKK